MRALIIGFTAMAIALPAVALADGNGAVTGAAGGAVAGAVVGGPVGAAVGGAAGGIVGGITSGPRTTVVEPVPVEPCASQTTTTQNDNTGASVTQHTTNCPD